MGPTDGQHANETLIGRLLLSSFYGYQTKISFLDTWTLPSNLSTGIKQSYLLFSDGDHIIVQNNP